VLIPVESMFLERIIVAVSLVITFAIGIFEHVQIWLISWAFKSRGVCFEVGLATSSYISIMF